MEKQPTQFPDRAALVAHVKALSPGVSDDAVSETRGGRAAAEALLAAIDPTAYGHSRNYLDGAVTRLSPYIRHAIVSLNELRNQALEMGDVKAIEKFIQELGWRDFGNAFIRKIPIGYGTILSPIKPVLWPRIMPTHCRKILRRVKPTARQ